MEGSGTEFDPYIITNVDELAAIQDDLGAWYELGCDIDASETETWNGGEGFFPIGDNTEPFTGVFDGRRHTITGLYIDRPSTVDQGMFGRFEGAVVSNVNLVDAYVRCSRGGTLAKNAYGGSVITGCSATGQLIIAAGSSDAKSGGLIGSVGGGSRVDQCFSGVDVEADRRRQVGSLIGYLRGVEQPAYLTNSYSYGTVTGSGWKQGNLLGDADGSNVDRCYSAGYGKALIGFNYRSPVITNCYWDKDKGASSSSRGGTPKTTDEMMRESTFVDWDFIDVWDIVEDESYPFLRVFTAPAEVSVDIKPDGCRNPLNAKSKGVLPVAILGTAEFDVNSIDIVSVRLAGVAPIRSSFEDVGTPVVDGNECACNLPEEDGYADLTLKFKTQSIVQELVNIYGDIEKNQEFVLALAGTLIDGTEIEGSDCVVIVGKVPDSMAAKPSDINGDGIINILDLSSIGKYWLESTVLY